MVEIINGKALAEENKGELIEKVAALSEKPVLAVVLVGDNEASKIYVNTKKKMADAIGIDCRLFHLSAKSTLSEVQALVKGLNDDESVHGVMVQLPLPSGLDFREVISLISPQKDVDGLGACNAGLLQMGSEKALVAATPKGILKMLKSTGVVLSGKHAVVIGRSNIVGRPMSSLLLNCDCTVTTAHSKTQNLVEIVKTADIVIAACGQAKLVKKEWIKAGAVVIDVGINRLDGKLCGDVDFDDVSEVAGYLSPVPGGVGPMTVMMLMENTYLAYLSQKGK
ncbi:MAG: bifunctional 5,10-methylenetetrahydrofolate dehydrogenase/5,10-methenyltetrahydrofolate cyclohydrolase [Alphaproteobacteria bacterium]|nr:bifunctional 5,10-methylenetetrahydrofolate dehydrogenase/5,10-methenyltetrahydrofolate cyclohydrolase [Alphaproteobacteria bacterium]